ncbi:MAG: VWA domain-containing protein [Armatimonadetes bacterium]|nr:VWA domain-containing protein [Armatimonadota bacterium]
MTSYFRWGAPHELIWLWLAVLLALLCWRAITWRLRTATRFCPVLPERRLGLGPLRERLYLKSGLLVLGCALVAVSLGRPQVGLHRERAQRKGADVMLVFDTSLSMNARDMMPSRLEAAKTAAYNLVTRLPNDRFGITVFAGDAQLYCPLTPDHDAVTMFVESIQTGTSPKPGTALAKAIATAGEALGESESKHRAMVILSDGEDHETGAVQAAEKVARQTATRIQVLGFGTLAGEPIPELDPQGRTIGLKRDTQGQIVLSKLGEAELQKLAAAGQGAYRRATDRGAVDEIAARLEALEGSQVGTLVYTQYGERFQWPLALALVLLAWEAMVAEHGRRRRAKEDRP